MVWQFVLQDVSRENHRHHQQGVCWLSLRDVSIENHRYHLLVKGKVLSMILVSKTSVHKYLLRDQQIEFTVVVVLDAGRDLFSR